MSSHPRQDPTPPHHLVKFGILHAAWCPALRIPPDGSSLARVKPMPARLRRTARIIAKPKECFYNAATLVFAEANIKYVVGYAATPLPVEHAWVKIGKVHYDPTWELFSTVAADYLPFFELNRCRLYEVMSELKMSYPPAVAELLNFANRGRSDVNIRFHERPTGRPPNERCGR